MKKGLNEQFMKNYPKHYIFTVLKKYSNKIQVYKCNAVDIA